MDNFLGHDVYTNVPLYPGVDLNMEWSGDDTRVESEVIDVIEY